MATYRRETIRGSACTGSDGDTGRTYTLEYAGYVAGTMTITKSGVQLYDATDYTQAGQVITFVGAVYNDDYIQLIYLTESAGPGLGSVDLPRYASTLELFRVLGAVRSTTDRDPGTAPVKELIGTGTGAAQSFYTDNPNIITNTFSLYYGASESAATNLLTAGTHYDLDVDTGEIELSAAGATLVSTNNLYARYSWNTLGVAETYARDVLLRAEAMVDEETDATFTDTTVNNPDYPTFTDILSTRQWREPRYFTKHRPVVDLESTLASSLTANASTLTLAAGDGASFPTSGLIVIENELISYTGVTDDTLTGLTRGVGDSDAAAHDAGAEVHTTVVEISRTAQGTAPVFEVLEHKVDFEINTNGTIFVHNVSQPYWQDNSRNFPYEPETAGRIRVRGLWGFADVPNGITRLTVLLAARMLARDNVLGSTTKGRNEFRPELLGAADAEINTLIKQYRQLFFRNV